ncbi:MAG: hypothetical protein COA57_08950 [Flavobacteriales bacterium]|nr:MAG: hypothetical protein COA57_08950 [Flavobacteriales bacterium]
MKKGWFVGYWLLAVGLTNYASAQLNVTELGKLTYTESLSDVWGWADGSGNEYALVGVNDGFSVVDITNPANPVEVFFDPGASTIWRDIKTWNNHAYVTNESTGGLLIVDLSTLPANPNLTTTSFTGILYPFESAHNLYIDENGICYLFGADYSEGGAIMLDLTVDPMNPVEVGLFDDFYFHDGVARGDTLFGGAISDGFTAAVDVSNKSNPQVLATWETPHKFSHNCWMSDNGNYVFTTDEVSGAYIASYDVSDLGNVTELDRYQTSMGNDVIPHNTHFFDNYLITSYYTAGVNIVDVSRPNNIVEVGWFDTSPQFSGNGFNGAWGAYPWLPSGNILITDIEEGLYILGPTYVRGCYLEGSVTDSTCGLSLVGVTIDIIGTSATDGTDANGDYAFGTVSNGLFDVQFSKPGYNTKIVSNVVLVNGQLTNLIVELYSPNLVSYSGVVSDVVTANLQGVDVEITNADNTYSFVTDVNGGFSQCNVVSGTYDITIGQWGYQTQCLQNQVINTTNNFLDVSLIEGYYDDFIFNYGWTASGDASKGMWERGDPKGTTFNGDEVNPEFDVTGDCGDKAYVTGNGGGSAGLDDVDDGTTILASPVFDLTAYGDAYLSYYRWFFNRGGFGTPNDRLETYITNGTDTVLIDAADTLTVSQWVFKNFRISDYISKSANMQVIFEAEDAQPGHLIEGAVDVFSVVDSAASAINDAEEFTGNWVVFPNPSKGKFEVRISNFEQEISNTELVIYNVLGEKVYSSIMSQQSTIINLQSKPDGVYFIHLQQEEIKTGMLKLVKMR